MKINQDKETGKLNYLFENHEKLDSFGELIEDYVQGLANVVSNDIGSDVVELRKN